MNIAATPAEPAIVLTVTRRLDRRVYPHRRPNNVSTPERVDARVKHAHDGEKAIAS